MWSKVVFMVWGPPLAETTICSAPSLTACLFNFLDLIQDPADRICICFSVSGSFSFFFSHTHHTLLSERTLWACFFYYVLIRMFCRKKYAVHDVFHPISCLCLVLPVLIVGSLSHPFYLYIPVLALCSVCDQSIASSLSPIAYPLSSSSPSSSSLVQTL